MPSTGYGSVNQFMNMSDEWDLCLVGGVNNMYMVCVIFRSLCDIGNYNLHD